MDHSNGDNSIVDFSASKTTHCNHPLISDRRQISLRKKASAPWTVDKPLTRTHLSVPQELAIRQRDGDPKPKIDTELPDVVHVYLKHPRRRAHGKHGRRVLEGEQRSHQVRRPSPRTLQIVTKSRGVPSTIASRRRRRRRRAVQKRTQRERVRARGRVAPQRTKRSREQPFGSGRRRGGMMGLGRQHEFGDHEARMMSELVELRVDGVRRRRSPRARTGRRRRGRVSVRR